MNRESLWNAINGYVAACGGDPSKGVYGNRERQLAVADIEAEVAFIQSPEVCGAAHDDVYACGYCQRDAARAELERERVASGTLKSYLDDSDEENKKLRGKLNAIWRLCEEAKGFNDSGSELAEEVAAVIASDSWFAERSQLFEFLKHGDEKHQAWLREAIDAYFDGKERPAQK